MAHTYDDVVIGAGAAGLFYAGLSGQMGRKVLVIDHAKKPAEKVRISGGGRCNFTNLYTHPDRFISQNPHFCKSALARYTPQDFLDLLAHHHISWHEKTLGQLFCDQRSSRIIQMLLDELNGASTDLWLETSVGEVHRKGQTWCVETPHALIDCGRVVIATGGLSIPKMGASGFAYDIARQFGHSIIATRPGLVPFVFEGQVKHDFASLSGLACDVLVLTNKAHFNEALLFTHRGLSGPAMLQISSYWSEGECITIDLFKGEDGTGLLKQLKIDRPMKSLVSALDGILPKRLIDQLAVYGMLDCPKLADANHEQLNTIAKGLSDWTLKPAGTEGYRTAEVTTGGIDTRDLSSKTMESKHVPGLYFIGECVDVTGWLGGYNFQWAWASAHAAARA